MWTYAVTHRPDTCYKLAAFKGQMPVLRQSDICPLSAHWGQLYAVLPCVLCDISQHSLALSLTVVCICDCRTDFEMPWTYKKPYKGNFHYDSISSGNLSPVSCAWYGCKIFGRFIGAIIISFLELRTQVRRRHCLSHLFLSLSVSVQSRFFLYFSAIGLRIQRRYPHCKAF